MGLLLDLKAETRAAMRAEIQADHRAGTLYISPRLSDRGASDYPELLLYAADSADDDWLAAQLSVSSRVSAYEATHSKTGHPYRKRVPVSAAETLAEGEFNRFYLRGLAVTAMAAGEADLEVFRAKLVWQPRPDSELLLGHRIDAEGLLRDLRSHPGVDTALGLPSGPNSGLSARRVQD